MLNQTAETNSLCALLQDLGFPKTVVLSDNCRGVSKTKYGTSSRHFFTPQQIWKDMRKNKKSQKTTQNTKENPTTKQKPI